MKFTFYVICFLLAIAAFACGPERAQSEVNATTDDEALMNEIQLTAEELLAKTVKAHGGERYDTAHYSFTFRNKTYVFKNNGSEFLYTVASSKDGDVTIDWLDNNQLTRAVNGLPVELTQKQIATATEALNSVVYFATLPHKLLDPAVNLEKEAKVTIKDKPYDALKVYFNQEGGGVDHEDNFRYWINQETGRIDYFAYDYQTNGGGVRFRSAYNPRVVEGILFQDYVNYKAAIGTDLSDLPALYEQGQLTELSRIETEKVVKL